MFQCIPYLILKKGNIEAALPNDNTTKYEMYVSYGFRQGDCLIFTYTFPVF